MSLHNATKLQTTSTEAFWEKDRERVSGGEKNDIKCSPNTEDDFNIEDGTAELVLYC